MKRTIFAVCILVLTVSIILVGSGNKSDQNGVTKLMPDLNIQLSYTGYTALLKNHVDSEGMVAYASLKENRSDLDAFIENMGTLHPNTFADWNTDQQLAFWINAYNAITLQCIIDAYPIEKGSLINRTLYPDNSIRQIDGVWKELTTPIMGESWTLDDIEHKVLRKRFDEPRIHIAIVCAAKSCPPLRAEAYEGEKLESQLEEESRRFLASASRFRIDEKKGKVYVSSIMDWFDKDFISHYNEDNTFSKFNDKQGAVLDFIAKHVDEETADYLKSQSYKISYLDYDWSLNEQ